MNKAPCFVVLLTATIMGQGEISNIRSDYYQGALFKKNQDAMTVANLIDYPGFFRNTTPQFGLGLANHGVLNYAQDSTNAVQNNVQNLFIVNPHSGFATSDFNGYGECSLPQGNVGLYMDNIYIRDYDSLRFNKFDDQGFQTSVLFSVWFAPKNFSMIRGVSMTYNCQHTADEIRIDNANNSYWDYNTVNRTSNFLHCKATALFSLYAKGCLRLSFEKNSGTLEHKAEIFRLVRRI